MACNASSAMPSGMRMASVTNCVTMSWPTSEIRMRLWPSTRPAFPSGETSQQAWHINIVAARNRSKIVRSGSFSPTLAAVATRCSTANSIFLVTGWKTGLVAKKRVFLIPSVFRPSVNWEDAMMQRVHQAQIPVAWVGASTVYGNHLDLRTWLEDHHYWFALAVASTEQIGMMTPEGRTHLAVAQAEQRFVNEEDWRRFSVKTGTKGPLLFEWACLPILHRWEDDGQHWLLIRRIPTQPTEKTYYLVFGPAGTSLEVMAWAVGSRWGIEEEFENAKDLGLDQYEVRSFVGWFRHVTLVLLVLAVVTVLCAKERGCSTGSSGEISDQGTASPIPLTVPEVRRLLGRLLFPLPRSVMAVLAWSWWRRCQQGRARASHAKHRLNSS